MRSSDPVGVFEMQDRCGSWWITRAERLDGATALLAVAGEFDLAALEPAGEVLRCLESRRPSLVVIDLGQLTFMDCQGLRFLAEARARAEWGGWALVVVAPPSPWEKLLALSGLDAQLNLTRTRPARLEKGRDAGARADAGGAL